MFTKKNAITGKMKFPRTRRDILRIEIKRQKAEQQRQEAVDSTDGIRKHIPYVGSSSHVTPSEHTAYPYSYAPDGRRNVFDQDSVQPLGANVESWSNLIDSRATSHQTQLTQTQSMPTYGEEELDDDEVFFNEDDMRKMRLGFTDPNSSYYMYPGAYAMIAMMGAVPEESHFGQGLEYFGPGYQVGASSLEIFFCMWHVLTYLLDVGSDIYVAYMYFTKGQYVWFGLTLAFVIITALTMTIFSLILYLRDHKLAPVKTSKCLWASRAMFLFLHLAPLFRMFETLVYGCKSRNPDVEIVKRRRFYDKMVNESTDMMLLRLVESFMEAAPQLVLQLYIITQIGTDQGTALVVVQVFALVTSLITLAGSLVSFQNSLRLSLPEKEKLRFPGMVLMFFWRLFTITARVLALAMFASYFQYWTFIAIGIHWIAMLIWIMRQDTKYCTTEKTEEKIKCNQCQEVFFRILCSFVHIFCFFNLLEGHTRLRCILFYCIMYAENAFFILAWYIGASMKTTTAWYHLPTMIMVLVGFWFGIFFQVIYYKLCHPNNSSVLNSQKRILWCVPFSQLSLTQETWYRPKPAGSVLNRSQLSLNQTMQSYHSVPAEQENPYIASTPACGAVIRNEVPTRGTPVTAFHPDRSNTLTDRSSLMSRQSSNNQGSRQGPRIVQKKWQPPERMPAGLEKLNLSRDSGSMSNTGSAHFRPTSHESRGARQPRTRGKPVATNDVDNQEPLPVHVQDTTPPAAKPSLNQPLPRVLPFQRTPPVLKVSRLPGEDSAVHEEPSDESDENSSSDSDLEAQDTAPLTNTSRHPPSMLQEDELPREDQILDEDELPHEILRTDTPLMKVTAI